MKKLILIFLTIISFSCVSTVEYAQLPKRPVLTGVVEEDFNPLMIYTVKLESWIHSFTGVEINK